MVLFNPELGVGIRRVILFLNGSSPKVNIIGCSPVSYLLRHEDSPYNFLFVLITRTLDKRLNILKLRSRKKVFQTFFKRKY